MFLLADTSRSSVSELDVSPPQRHPNSRRVRGRAQEIFIFSFYQRRWRYFKCKIHTFNCII